MPFHGSVNAIRNVHPFLLADNRHYTFYIWRLMSRFNGIILYALVPAYMAAAWFCWQALGMLSFSFFKHY
jgi:alpha-1,2-glucosyltransferase